MKKLTAFVLAGILAFSSASAQKDTLLTINEPVKKKEKIDLTGRANDHFLFQYGYSGWTGAPDSVNTGGFGKAFNIYLMMDFPFKATPKLSVGIGVGVGSDHVKFQKTFIDIKANSSTLPFLNQADTNYFKKTKLTTAYVEAPIELRYTANPLKSDKSFKAAVGIKVGYLLNAHTRYKTLVNKAGSTINDYKLKESSDRFFNSARFVGIARVGWGNFSVFGSYQLNTLFSEGVAAEIRPFSVGLTLSGL